VITVLLKTVITGHNDKVIARVHPVHLMDVEQRQALATLGPSQQTWV